MANRFKYEGPQTDERNGFVVFTGSYALEMAVYGPGGMPPYFNGDGSITEGLPQRPPGEGGIELARPLPIEETQQRAVGNYALAGAAA